MLNIDIIRVILVHLRHHIQALPDDWPQNAWVWCLHNPTCVRIRHNLLLVMDKKKMNDIVVKVSHATFWGYQITLPRDVCLLAQEIQTEIVNTKVIENLSRVFRENNLELLEQSVNKLILHLHGPLVVDVVNYACDYDHKSDQVCK